MKKAVLLLTLMLAVLTGCALPDFEPTSSPSELINSTEEAEAFASMMAPTDTPTPAPTPTETPVPPPTVFTGAILGLDSEPQRPDRNIFGVRSDVNLVFHLEEDWTGHTELTIISFPRDLWLSVPCSPLDPELEGQDRINAAWAYGKFECFEDTIDTNFPISINAPMVAVDFEGFLDIVEHFDGVEVTATETYSDWCGSYHGTWGEHGRRYTWVEGESYQMDANELLCYVRARKGASDGDLDRNRRHLEVIQAMMKQWPADIFDTMNPLDMAAELKFLFTTFNDSFQTNANFTDFIPLLKYVNPFLQGDMEVNTINMNIEQEVDFYRTPIYNASVLKPKVDLRYWLGCMLLTDGAEPCTAIHQLTPTPEPEDTSAIDAYYQDALAGHSLEAVAWCSRVVNNLGFFFDCLAMLPTEAQ